MGPSREERTKEITQKRRQQIIEMALDIFVEKGFTGATTSEIARAAGVAEGTIFRYFSSKRELFVTVMRDFIVTMPLLELIDRLPQGDLPATLGLIMQNRFSLLEGGAISKMPVLMADVIRDPELKEVWVKEFLQPLLNRIETVFRSLQASGLYRDMEPAVAVRSVGGMIMGFMLFRILEGEQSPLQGMEQARIAGTFVDLLLHGVLREAKG